jgi:beta-ureidopropionase / N-carbamoyl-L-amino-acid hydrolase
MTGFRHSCASSRRAFLGSALGGIAYGSIPGLAFDGGSRHVETVLLRLAGSRRPPVRVDGARLNRRLAELSVFGRNEDGGIDRVGYSDADLAARRWTVERMREAGLLVRIDSAANIRGRREGREPSLPAIMTGSHIDSVPGGGNYDGQVGSMAAIEVAQSLGDQPIETRHPLEIILFQNEENGKAGSKAIRGDDGAAWLDLPTNSGKTIREGIRFLGGDPDRLRDSRIDKGAIAAFLELHIEQGAVLDQRGTDIGIVEGIVGIRRWAVTVEGFANHAGTTPMDQRQDALLAAARFIDAANRITRSVAGRQVATVGTIAAEPGAANVIAGRARLTLEMRDLDLAKVDRVFDSIRAAAADIGRDTGTTFGFEPIYRSLPAITDEAMRSAIEASARELGLSTLAMPSGAGHDAQEMAQIAPTGMIFVPSVGGISHSPRELTHPADITNGANVLINTILRIDNSL